jgi:hypothetical protein
LLFCRYGDGSEAIAMGTPIQRHTPALRKSNLVSFTPASSTALQGWKEIAAELDRSVRTVQRWALKFGLPVHKLGDGVGSPVFAFKEELHSWLRTKADEEIKIKTGTTSKMSSLNDDELFSGILRATSEKGREVLDSQPTASEPEIIKSLNAFFALKGAKGSSPLCNHCHASTRLLVGHFWLYGTEKTWQVSVPFCPECDSDLRAMLPSPTERLT